MCEPFKALVGQEQLRTALVLNAIDTSLGGVLLWENMGHAKRTAARADVLAGECRLLEKLSVDSFALEVRPLSFRKTAISRAPRAIP